MELQKSLKFLQHFSIITIGDKKVPNFPWKAQQTEKLSEEQFTNQYNSPSTKAIGICTGYDYLECVDVDLKVFSTAQEQREFWDEFITMLRDHILDFDDKIAIYKTANAGFHLLYKSKRVQGNLKLAKLKGHNEAVIETRGVGGYIFVYPDNQYSKLSYFKIDFITDEEREVIMHCAKMYNYSEVKEVTVEPKVKKEYNGINKSPWQDYNEKTDVWDLLHSEFTIPQRGNKAKHILIKRHGSQSAYSGYIYKNSGCVYLFSTGTRYPHEKLLTPYHIYTIQNHGGDLSAAAKDLYKQGYGDRIQNKIKELSKSLPDISEYDVKKVAFPIDIYPEDLQKYLMECNDKLDANIDYTGSALLWLISVCVGNSFEIEVKKGWTENATVWISLVGKAGIGKTPSINKIIYPLEKINIKETKKFAKEYAKFKEYEELSKKDKESVPEVTKPKKMQFIANDITVEALVDLHQESDNAVGVFKDELAGWLKDMNKYRAGSDLEFWLSVWSGKSVYLNRISRESSFVDKPFIPVMGGIQPNILSAFYTDENKDNGFMDRMLLSFPDAVIERYNENELSEEILDWYNEAMTMFYNECKKRIKYDEEGVIVSHKATLTPEAKAEWVRIFNNITDTQNSDDENEYLKSMYPKLKSYIPRFALLIHLIHCHFHPEEDFRYISKESMLKAERLSDYFINNAKKLRIDSERVNEMKQLVKGTVSKADKIAALYQSNPEYKQIEIAELVGVKRQYVGKIIAELKKAT